MYCSDYLKYCTDQILNLTIVNFHAHTENLKNFLSRNFSDKESTFIRTIINEIVTSNELIKFVNTIKDEEL